MSKKKRIARSFDFDVVRSRIEEEKGEIIEIRKHFEALNKFDLQRVLSSLSEDEIIQLLACKLKFRTLEVLRKAMQHVPKNIPRIVDGHSLRNVFIHKVFNSTCSTSMSIEEVAMYVDVLELLYFLHCLARIKLLYFLHCLVLNYYLVLNCYCFVLVLNCYISYTVIG